MKLRFQFWIIPALCVMIITVLSGGCASYRGIPGHGGGKRFDEEERIVSASIRRAIADMDLIELNGKRVEIVINAISHSGGGYNTFPSLNPISANIARGENDSNSHSFNSYRNALLAYSGNTTIADSEGTNKAFSLGTSYDPRFIFSSAIFNSDPDINYLMSVLTMKAHHDGLIVDPAASEYTLFVLVDVLGVNRSRLNHYLYWSDEEKSSCEITYYALANATQQLYFSARSTSGVSIYKECSFIGMSGYRIERETKSLAPTAVSVSDRNMLLISDVVKPTTPTLTTVENVTPEKIDESVKEYLDTRIRNADLQLQAGNLDEARRLLDSVRTIDPNHPRLNEVEDRLRQELNKRRESQTQGNQERLSTTESVIKIPLINN